jgi:excisionase family DNA binding protein
MYARSGKANNDVSTRAHSPTHPLTHSRGGVAGGKVGEPVSGPELLTLEQTAAALGVAKSTVEEWVSQKRLASFKVGRVRRVAREDLARFIGLHTVKARRPDWCTADVETELRRMVREIVREFQAGEPVSG